MAFDILIHSRQDPYVLNEAAKLGTLHKYWEAEDPSALIAKIKDTTQYIISSPASTKIDGPFMAQFPNLKAVVCFGVGYDPVDANWARDHNIMVTHTPDVLNDEVADMSIGLLLSVVRQIPQADLFVRQGHWAKKQAFPFSASLSDRTMGILGLGRIGKAIAKRAEAFGLKIIYHGRHQQTNVAYPYYADLKEMAKACDILMVVAPGTAETKHIVNREVLEALGPEGILINVARGVIIDEGALIEALEQKKILSAGLDVYAQEPNVPAQLIALPQVVLSPHIASASAACRRAIGQLVIDNLTALSQGKPALTPVPEMKK